MATTIKYNAKKRTYTGTNENDIMDATLLDYVVPVTGKFKDKGLIIKGGKGNDTITGTAGNDTITGGVGENTVVVKMESFGNDEVNLTKGEDLVIDLSAHTELIELGDLKFTLVGKNLIITVPEDEEYDFGKITLKNYTKNTLNSLTFKFFEQEPIIFNSFSELTESVKFLYKNEHIDKKGVLTASNYDDDIWVYNKTNGTYTINAGNGINEINVVSGKYVINSGEDNDYISITDYNKKGSYNINAGGGENTIYLDNYDEYGEVIISEQKLNAINTIELSEDLKNPEYKRVNSDMYITDDNGTIILKSYYEDVKNKSSINIKIGWDGEIQTLSDYLSDKTTQITGSGKINGTDCKDIITIEGNKATTIIAGKGDDVIGTSKCNRTIYLYEGDGNDIIETGSGTDNLRFANGTDVTPELVYSAGGKTQLVLHYGTKGDTVTFSEYNNKSKVFYYIGDKKYSLSSLIQEGEIIIINTDTDYCEGTNKNDTITDSLDHTSEITINALGGDDYIEAHHDIVYAGAGNDYIYSKDSVVFGDDGDDIIVNYDSTNENNNVELFGGSGNDKIINEEGSNARSIFGGEGNDTIINNGDVNRNIDGGNGDNTITNNSSITGSINCNYGNDIIINNGTILGDLVGGDGNDAITNNGQIEGVIRGGRGDDIITTGADSSSSYLEFCEGDGHDILYLNSEKDVLHCDQQVIEYSWGNNKKDLTLYYNNHNDSITIKDFNTKKDNIYINSETLLLSNLIDTDFYKMDPEYVDLMFSKGNDIINIDFSCGRINSMSGDDIITVNGNTSQIFDGDGDDIITINGRAGEIYVEKGNDTITVNGNVDRISFWQGGGNDTLYLNNNVGGLSSIESESNLNCSLSNNDLIIGYNNNNDSVTIKNYNNSIHGNIPIDYNIGTEYYSTKLRELISSSMYLGTSNTRISELSVNVLAFTSASNSDVAVSYTTPDTNNISLAMSEYTNTDLQGNI